jgi:RNA polymerase sigma-70 factor (ECF subfamily)
MTPFTDLLPEIVFRLRQGGKLAERAAADLYRHYYPRFVRRYVLEGQGEAEAAEIANDAMVNVVRGIVRVERPAALPAWIWTVARNTLISRVRATRGEKRHETQLDDDGWDDLLASVAGNPGGDPLTRLCLERQLERFEREHPQRILCLELAVIDGLDLPAIATVIARSYQATREYLSQCRKHLWVYLKSCLD